MAEELSGLNLEILHQLRDLHKQQADNHTKNSELLSGATTNIALLRNELFGDGGRISSIEERMKTQDKRQWIHTAIIIPLLAVLQLIAKKLGVFHG